MSHTPGPWTYYLDEAGYFAVNHNADASEPGDLAHVYYADSGDDRDREARFNAALIAAAPDLLGALIDVENYLVARVAAFGMPVDERHLTEVQAVIRKAKGELP